MLNGSNSTLTISDVSQRPTFIAIQYLVIWCSVYLTIATFAILGNVLIIMVFINKRSLRTRTNYFVIGLAVGDVLVGTATIPLYVTLLILLFHQDFKAAVHVQTIFSPMDILSGMLSILHLMTISVERVYAIAFPLRHRTSSSKSNLIILAIVWLTAAGIASLNFVIPKGPQWKGTFLIYSTLGFFVPFSVIFFAYTSIWIIVKNKTKISRSRARTMKRESRTAYTILVLILLFLVTWLPFFSLNLVLFSCTKCATAVPLQVVLFFKALHYSGSALNPVVYSARMPEFRRPVITLLQERKLTGSLYHHSTERQSFRSTIRRREVELSDICDQQRTNDENDTDPCILKTKIRNTHILRPSDYSETHVSSWERIKSDEKSIGSV
ncbi:octopamine receptor beta-2R-like [Montipora foliosa]|uniref:octopamine receptor beta-2R-like n=1 Tax=Montipora foliosa TaxID=591990 RepID=UPI0035F11256